MSIAAAQSCDAASNDTSEGYRIETHGAQTLLRSKQPQPNYPAQAGAALAYALVLGLIVTLSYRTADAPVEEQQVIELAPMPVEEESPPEDTLPDPEEVELPEPPPPVIEPVAPIEQVKPKPIQKPKVEKKIERPPTPRRDAAPARARTGPAAPGARGAADRAPAASPGATPSAIANHFHACMQRAAANAYPESQSPRTARITYRATFNAAGALTSYSISPSGNGAFDAVANRLGGRCASVPAPGKPVSLSGGLTFSP